jgi:putative phage DNA-binding protein
MGLLDFIFWKKETHLPKIVLPKYSPIEPYVTPHPPELDKVSLELQKISDNYYHIHINNISSFDYRFIQDTNEKELSCVEKSFLKYVCGRHVHDTYIAGYWTHTYGIDYRAVMSKFFNLGVLSATIDLQHCTVKSLKDILRMKHLPVSGKKADLIARIGDTNSLTPQELGVLEEYRAYTPTEYGNAIISTVQETESERESFNSFSEMKILFTEEEVRQHEEIFFVCLKEALQKEKLTIESKEIYAGWRFIWCGCQIGQIKFSEYGHWMQWISGAYPVDWEKISKNDFNDINEYIHDASGDIVSADGLSLQECIDKIPYWIQYLHLLMAEEDM